LTIRNPESDGAGDIELGAGSGAHDAGQQVLMARGVRFLMQRPPGRRPKGPPERLMLREYQSRLENVSQWKICDSRCA
jgi:hypothetical protein